MSLITSCPACTTMFRVVPDQLKVSDGWVRCGQCGEVFDASLHLQASEGVEPVLVDHGQSGEAVSVAVESTGQLDLTAGTALAADSGGRIPVEDPLPPVTASLAQDPDAQKADTEGVPVEPAPDVSFVRQARRREMWRRPEVRMALGFVALLMVLTLVAQITYHERDRIATLEPRTLPWLEQACAQIGCEIKALRQIEWISIDSSGFSKIRNDTYRLQVALKNASPFDLAMPAIELTLTDAQDQPVLRRVLEMGELGVRGNLLRASSELPVSVAVSVASNGARISGYRVLAFYP